VDHFHRLYCQTGYNIATGSSTNGSTRTVTCVTGYSGTATSITCGSNGAWSSSTGCTIISCGTPIAPTGYGFVDGAHTYGTVLSTFCNIDYIGTPASLTCEASGSWTAFSGCIHASCEEPANSEGYIIGAGGNHHFDERTVICASGFRGEPENVVCQETSEWTTPSGCEEAPSSIDYNTSSVFYNTAASSVPVLPITFAMILGLRRVHVST